MTRNDLFWLVFVFVISFVTGALLGDEPTTTGPSPKAFEVIYVFDGHQNRKLIRWEGESGNYGDWQEDFCQRPGQTAWMYPTAEWPKPIDTQTVQRLLGERRFQWFENRKRAFVSKTYNLTRDRFTISGVRGVIR